MTASKEYIRAKTMELINQLPEFLVEKLDHLLAAGVIDFETTGEGYEVPKLILCALGREIEAQYFPRYMLSTNQRRAKREVTNFYTHL
jgi:hypothetical protein